MLSFCGCAKSSMQKQKSLPIHSSYFCNVNIIWVLPLFHVPSTESSCFLSNFLCPFNHYPTQMCGLETTAMYIRVLTASAYGLDLMMADAAFSTVWGQSATDSCMLGTCGVLSPLQSSISSLFSMSMTAWCQDHSPSQGSCTTCAPKASRAQEPWGQGVSDVSTVEGSRSRL